MNNILTSIIAKHLENGWQVSVSYKKPDADTFETREFIIANIMNLPTFLQNIEKGDSLT